MARKTPRGTTVVNTKHLRSRKRRGRWFHTYRRDGQEVSLGVHGLDPDDPRVIATYTVQHEKWGRKAPPPGKFAHAITAYYTSDDWQALAEGMRKMRRRILDAYASEDGDRPLDTIDAESIEAALSPLKPHARGNHIKALRGLFKWAEANRLVERDPAKAAEVERAKVQGHPTASPDNIAAFRAKWPIGTTERLVYDLAIYTGAARVDLAKLGPQNIKGDVLVYTRQKSGVTAYVPMTPELRALIATAMETRGVVPMGEERPFILSSKGRGYRPESLGNLLGEAARAAGRAPGKGIRSARKAFCVYQADRGYSVHQIAAMAGHITLSEVQRYTAEADRKRMVEMLVRG